MSHVIVYGNGLSNFWGVPTEVKDVNSAERYLKFQIQGPNTEAPIQQVERYYLTYCRRLGANRRIPTGVGDHLLHFAVWAPNAQAVSVVFGYLNQGHIDDQGIGINNACPEVVLTRSRDGVWEGSPEHPYNTFQGLPYMYKVRNKQGELVYRTDIFSRSQIGKGDQEPPHWDGSVETLDGLLSCSVVIDPDVIREEFESTAPNLIAAEEFWATEFSHGRAVPTNLNDLVIYELHIGSLGFGRATSGDLSDAIELLHHLRTLGVNAVELMPMAEFEGKVGWGYGNTHHLCVESSAGGRDKYRHFVRECHRNGIAVIQDVCYNHYAQKATRAEWTYDSTLAEDNIYYWYEGRSSQYSDSSGGYIDNGSSGYTPRFWNENVRQQFISSAAFLIEEMHVDGLRVDLTDAIHRDNKLHADGREIGHANVFGQKFLRQWSRTLYMIKPSVMLIAEDHTRWDAVTKLPAQDGLGFQARWEVEFYHSLIGDSNHSAGRPRLLLNAGFGGNNALEFDKFSETLYNTQYRRVVFPESHDEAGNAEGTARTILVAVNHAPVFGPTRTVAEARCRLCYGLSLLSAATPMFFMGEEVGAQQPYKYEGFIHHREDIIGLRDGIGASMFHFYRDLISLRKRLASIRSHNIDVLHQSNSNRVIAFKRWSGNEEVIVVGSLNNSAFSNGYTVWKDATAIPNGTWKEVFNSDSAFYGGQNIGNYGQAIQVTTNRLNVVLPANSFVVFVKQ
ncbi:glycoside hydrolase [Decorospora gaudefroyi]|uniref:1,4-alpha-glucan branching enzyme n=1 Tax=Decorospora gaudefroyi TaxID=184978 RepID=A0A6A5KIL0_9PLEO|nr:glycoside hydrolase [Decorospora gaudefroyi]